MIATFFWPPNINQYKSTNQTNNIDPSIPSHLKRCVEIRRRLRPLPRPNVGWFHRDRGEEVVKIQNVREIFRGPIFFWYQMYYVKFP